MNPRISIIVPAFNAKDTIAPCLAALQGQAGFTPGIDFEIIVVDDGSTDNTASLAEQMSVKVIRQANAGPAAARNAGVKAARGELVVFTDADCVPSASWLATLTEPFREDAVVGVKGSYQTKQHGCISRFVQIEYESKYQRMKQYACIDFIDTYAAAFRKSVFLENGGFDPSFTKPSVEDQEFSFRLAAQGLKMVFQPGAVVYHIHDRTIGDYWNRKIQIGFWKAFLLRKIPGRVRGDSHTPLAQRAQMALMGVFCASLLLATFVRFATVVMFLSATAFWVSTIPFLFFLIKRDKQLLPVAIMMLPVRALATGLGLAFGWVYFAIKSQIEV